MGGKEKGWYHAVGLDEQKVVLLWTWRIKGEQAKHLGESGLKWFLETAENLSKNFAGHGPPGDLTHCVQITTQKFTRHISSGIITMLLK